MLDKSLRSFFPGKPRFISQTNIDYKREIDEQLITRLVSFINTSLNNLSRVGLTKAVVGFSGGIDSAIICELLKKAVGTKAVAVIVDFEKSENYSEDTKSSLKILEHIGLNSKVIKGGQVLDEYLRLMGNRHPIAKINLTTRTINNLIFQFADNEFAAVVDTTDKSEELLGRYAECFYGHFAPLINLYKTELYDLGETLSIPKSTLLKQPGCPDLLDIEAFGVGWDIIDPLLFLLADKKYPVERIAKEYKIDKVWLAKLRKRIDEQPNRTKTARLIL